MSITIAVFGVDEKSRVAIHALGGQVRLAFTHKDLTNIPAGEKLRAVHMVTLPECAEVSRLADSHWEWEIGLYPKGKPAVHLRAWISYDYAENYINYVRTEGVEEE